PEDRRAVESSGCRRTAFVAPSWTDAGGAGGLAKVGWPASRERSGPAESGTVPADGAPHGDYDQRLVAHHVVDVEACAPQKEALSVGKLIVRIRRPDIGRAA